MTTATAVATLTDTAIHTRALLVWLQISTWSARRYDKQVSQEVNTKYQASSDAGRYNKMLLPGDAKTYKDLIIKAGAIRAQHYKTTLAWSDEGWRILPIANYDAYTDQIRQDTAEFRQLLNAFLYDYPALRSDAVIRLKGLYRDDDYPQSVDMRDRFKIAVQYMPVPAAGDIRVDLASDQVQAIESTIASSTQQATAAAMKDCWSRLHVCVSHIAERLTDPTAIFRDSLIDNAKEITDVLTRLNITNDPDLERMRQAVADRLIVAPDTLRDDPRTRQRTADAAADILAQMSAAFGGTL